MLRIRTHRLAMLLTARHRQQFLRSFAGPLVLAAGCLVAVSSAHADEWAMEVVDSGLPGEYFFPHNAQWYDEDDWADPDPGDSQLFPVASDTVLIAPIMVSNAPNITLSSDVEVRNIAIGTERRAALNNNVVDIIADFYDSGNVELKITPDPNTGTGGKLSILSNEIHDAGGPGIEYGNADVYFYDMETIAKDVLVQRSADNENGRATLIIDGGTITATNSFRLERSRLILQNGAAVAAYGTGLNVGNGSSIVVGPGGGIILGDVALNDFIQLQDVDPSDDRVETFLVGSVSGGGVIDLGNRHDLVFSQSGENPANSVLTGNITGPGRIWIRGAQNTVEILGGNSTSDGLIVEQGATLVVGAANRLGTLGNHFLQLSSGGTLQASNDLSVALQVFINNGAIDTNGHDIAYSGQWDGPTDSVLTKKGAGTLSVNNDAADYTGSIVVEAGTLVSGADWDTFHNRTGITLHGAATLRLDGDENFGGVSGGGTVNPNGHIMRVGYFDSDHDFTGDVTGSGQVQKFGEGEHRFTGDNRNFTGTWGLFTGTLTFGNTPSLPAALHVPSDGTLRLDPTGQAQMHSGFTGPGRVLKTGTGQGVFPEANPSLTGHLEIAEGEFRFDAAPSFGEISIGATGTLTTTLSSLVLPQEMEITGNGATINTGLADVFLMGDLKGDNNLVIEGFGSLSDFGSSSTFSGDIHVKSGTFGYGTSGMLAGSTLTIDSGASVRGTTVGGGFTVVYDVGELTGGGTLNVANQQEFQIGGNNSASTFAGNFTGTGNVKKVGAGYLTLSGDSGTFEGQFQLAEGYLSLAGVNLPSLLIKNGTEVEAEGTNTIGLLSGGGNLLLNSAGTFRITGDSPDFAGDISATLGKLNVAGTVAADDVTVAGSGIVTGDGQLDSTLSVQSGGTVSPGLTLGQLTVADLELHAGATALIELGGADAGQFDVLSVAEDAALGGMLDVRLVLSYAPTLGDTLPVLEVGGTSSGQFDGLDPNAVFSVGSSSFQISYTGGDGNDVVLTAVSGIAGDYNNDGAVNIADYTVWRNNLGAAAGTLLNDIDATMIGTAQYETWKVNFGTSLPPSSALAGTAVPEPSSCVLLALFALASVALRGAKQPPHSGASIPLG
ncbi:autotransporter-associated beta strand repeat-containing protein [Aeoliella sp.]|uniref:autotransporter-associated beta strand repeat-containing protein n=1 Tax=Aeoliella sp. TaxID=2795800 RepID=UPI003CCBC99E